MQQTSNYNLNLPEGTDIVNPLVDYNPNFTVIDGAMKANADRTVGRATCIKSGTTHVVTRSNTGSNIINFTATGDWNEGDTMTIDSTIVSVFLPDGSAALDGAYLINSEVFGILNGTRFTLYSNIADVAASDVSYNNLTSGLQAANVQDAVDELSAKFTDSGWVSVFTTTNSFVKYRRKNGIMYVSIKVHSSDMISADWTNAGTLPNSPVSDISDSYYDKYNDIWNCVNITTSGAVVVKGNTSTNSMLVFPV